MRFFRFFLVAILLCCRTSEAKKFSLGPHASATYRRQKPAESQSACELFGCKKVVTANQVFPELCSEATVCAGCQVAERFRLKWKGDVATCQTVMERMAVRPHASLIRHSMSQGTSQNLHSLKTNYPTCKRLQPGSTRRGSVRSYQGKHEDESSKDDRGIIAVDYDVVIIPGGRSNDFEVKVTDRHMFAVPDKMTTRYQATLFGDTTSTSSLTTGSQDDRSCPKSQSFNFSVAEDDIIILRFTDVVYGLQDGYMDIRQHLNQKLVRSVTGGSDLSAQIDYLGRQGMLAEGWHPFHSSRYLGARGLICTRMSCEVEPGSQETTPQEPNSLPLMYPSEASLTCGTLLEDIYNMTDPEELQAALEKKKEDDKEDDEEDALEEGPSSKGAAKPKGGMKKGRNAAKSGRVAFDVDEPDASDPSSKPRRRATGMGASHAIERARKVAPNLENLLPTTAKDEVHPRRSVVDHTADVLGDIALGRLLDKDAMQRVETFNLNHPKLVQKMEESDAARGLVDPSRVRRANLGGTDAARMILNPDDPEDRRLNDFFDNPPLVENHHW